MNHPVLLLVSGILTGLLLGFFLHRLASDFLEQQISEQHPWDGKPDLPSRLRQIVFLLMLPLASGALAAWRGWSPELLSDLLLTGSLFVLAVIDWESMLLDMRVVIVAIMLKSAWLFMFAIEHLQQALIGLLVGAGLLYLLGIIYETLRKRRGLGEGDPALLGLIGMWVGWPGLGPVLLVAAFSGIILGGIWLLRKNQPLLHTPVPFGPFLCLGGLLVHLLQQSGWMPWQMELIAF